MPFLAWFACLFALIASLARRREHARPWPDRRRQPARQRAASVRGITVYLPDGYAANPCEALPGDPWRIVSILFFGDDQAPGRTAGAGAAHDRAVARGVIGGVIVVMVDTTPAGGSCYVNSPVTGWEDFLSRECRRLGGCALSHPGLAGFADGDRGRSDGRAWRNPPGHAPPGGLRRGLCATPDQHGAGVAAHVLAARRRLLQDARGSARTCAATASR